MKSKLVVAALGALLSVSLIGVSSASAATEFGDNCVADRGAENSLPGTAFGLSTPGNPLSLAAPSSGVITSWKIVQNVSPSPVPQALKVLRQTSPLTVQIIGESTQTVNLGPNTFETRIPVQAGDRLGLFGIGIPGILLCHVPSSNPRLGVAEGLSNVGSSANFTEIETETRVPAAAVVEPDADNDGFGDETQDKCPQNGSVQTACPVSPVNPVSPVSPVSPGTPMSPAIPAVGLSASSVAKRGLVTVLITSTAQAPVTVTGTARLGKGKTAKLKGGTQIVAPGSIARFTILFPKKLKNKLKQLSRKQRLTLNLTATAVNAAGQPSATALKVRLKGQAKAKKRRGQAKP